MSQTCFYVYIIFRLDGSPCYVGKGKGNRWRAHGWFGARHANKRLGRIFAKASTDLPIVKIRENLTHEQAIEIEAAFIKAIGWGHNGPLANMNDGGEGNIGWVPSAKTRDRIAKSNTGRKDTAEARLKKSLASKGKPKSPSHRAAIGKGNCGKVMSDIAIERMSHSAFKRSQKTSLDVKSYHATMTAEQKAARALKISIATKAAMADPSIRAKIVQNRGY